MANQDLRSQQRAKLLASGIRKPKVTLSKKKSIEASKRSIKLISKPYNEEMKLA